MKALLCLTHDCWGIVIPGKMKPKAEDSMSSVCGFFVFFLQPYIYISLVFVMFKTKLLLIHDDVPVCMPIVSSYKCDDYRIVCKLVANTTS